MTAAARTRIPKLRTDWFRVLVSLHYAGWPLVRVSKHLDIPHGTLRGWKQGAEPPHCHGERLLALWAEVTELSVDQRPVVFD